MRSRPLRALRLSAVRERDDDPATLAQHRAELVLGLREPARGDGRALGLERVRLPVRERVELGDAVERRALERLLGPDARRRRPAARRSPGLRSSGGTRSSARTGSSAAVRLGVDEIATPLGRRIDHRLGDRMQRALRERRERAELLDHVAEELDAERLPPGARKDVDEAAANRDLPALLDPLDALVAGESERPRRAPRGPARRPARAGSASGGLRAAASPRRVRAPTRARARPRREP